jgi:hypothetical protein
VVIVVAVVMLKNPTSPTPLSPSPPTTRMPTLAPDLQLICAWMELPPTTCPTATYAEVPRGREAAAGTIPTQLGLLTSLADFLYLDHHASALFQQKLDY